MKNDFQIYQSVIKVGEKKGQKKPSKTIIAAILAGMYIALSGMAYLTSLYYFDGSGMGKLIGSFLFPTGLLLILITGAELFTGNNLLTLAWLHHKITLPKLGLNWLLVWIFNAIGAFVIALFISKSGIIHDTFSNLVYNVLQGKLELSFMEAFMRGILCNLLVAIAVWLSYGAETLAGKLFAIWMPITVFVFSGFEHSVANMFYFSFGYLEGMTSSISSILVNNLIPVTLGNVIGGGLILPVLYFGINAKSTVNGEEKNQ